MIALGWRNITFAIGLVMGATMEAQPGLAQEAQTAVRPIDLSADGAIEWRRDQKAYVATGNATVRDGDATVRADRLVAHYRESPGGNTEIWRIEMTGHVRIELPDGTIEGDAGAYEADSRVLVMTGRALRYDADTVTVTATESLEYWRDKRMAVARGKALAIDGRRNVRADILTAHLHDKDNGETGIERFDAFGNIFIETETEILKAEKAVYDPGREVAKLSGSVKITRGQNQLNGDYAELDFKSGVSTLRGEGSSKVRGLIVPGGQ